MSNFLLDTSALIDDPNIVYQFEGATVLLSTITLQELDGLKESKDYNKAIPARRVIDILDKARRLGNLSKGVGLENGSTLRVLPPIQDLFIYSEYGKIPDTMILSTAFREELEHVRDDLSVVSADSNFRVIASTLGINVFEYVSKERAMRENEYLGYVDVEDTVLENSFNANGAVHISKFDIELVQNQYVRFVNNSSYKKEQSLGIVKGEHVVPLRGKFRNKAGRFETKNFGQKLLADALTDTDITVITCEGVAGTGKTIESLAFSLKQVDENMYKKVICYRALAPLDEGIGFLPGDKSEKLEPWVQPIYDNLEVLGRDDLYLDNGEVDGILEVDALTYARGRSLPNVIIIVDEAQNLTRLQAKTMATRLGEGAKIIFLYDPEQIDHKYLDRWNNGGRHVSTRLRGQDIHAHITLTETVRSKTAAICAKYL